jgi:hypothetical protein
MDDAIEVVGLGGLVQQAIKLIHGVEISQKDERFVFSVLSVVPWFKVRGGGAWGWQQRRTSLLQLLSVSFAL